MNPASAGGKPLRVLPTVEAALNRAGADYRVVETRDIPHAAEAAHEAAAREETVVALGGVFVERTSKFRFVANLPKVFAGTHVDLYSVATHRAREVEITADRPFDVYADGEPITSLPAAIKVIPGALRVIAPRP